MPLSIFLWSAILSAACTFNALTVLQAREPLSNFKEEKLSPELAKEALLDMMRSKALNDFGCFNSDITDEMAKMEIGKEKDGWYAWTAAFRFNPSKAIYTFVVRPVPGARACAFEYKGSFVRNEGAWSATQPQLVRTVLQRGH
jgi:hypothetical protein